MRSIAILAALAMLSGGVGLSLAQEAEEIPDEAEQVETDQAAPNAQQAGDDNDSFRPSEEVEADTAVAFPTDI